MRRRRLQTRPPVGTRVRLTGYFLRATGQLAGGDGQRRWKIAPCECSMCRGDFVAVDERPDPEVYADVPERDRPQWRHIHLGNLEIVGAPPRAADQPEEVHS